MRTGVLGGVDSRNAFSFSTAPLTIKVKSVSLHGLIAGGVCQGAQLRFAAAQGILEALHYMT